MKALLYIALMLLTVTAASAQQKTFYDSSGRSVGTAQTDSQGSNTFRDSSGRTTGRTATDSQGTTTLYDASGKVIGRETPRR